MTQTTSMTNTPISEPATPVNDAAIITTITRFLAAIGIPVDERELPDGTFLPGISPEGGVLCIDRARLLHPGDLLHEAGHIACATPEARAAMRGHAGDDPAEEMMAIAWSYAAALECGIDPAVVFHEHGYHGGGSAIRENFAEGRFFGVPVLAWLGMTEAPEVGAERPYPAMTRWVR